MALSTLVSAKNSGDTWDLRRYVRERLIEFMQTEHPDGLPKVRTLVHLPRDGFAGGESVPSS